jgi:tetratricopeptide (TPR) repeat protein
MEKFKEKGNEYFKNKNYDLALECYTKGIEITPTSILYTNRASCYLNKKQYEKGLLDTNKSIELDNKYVKGYYLKSLIEFEQGELLQSIDTTKEGC